MPNVRIKMKDGTVKEFLHTGSRAGGSYTVTVRYEGEWVIVTDEYGKETAIPNHLVECVETEPHRGRW